MNNGTGPGPNGAGDQSDPRDLDILVDNLSPHLAVVSEELDHKAERMIVEDIHHVPMTMEQAQAAEGILRAWLLQMRDHPSARFDLQTRKMLEVVQRTQNVFADYLNAYLAALSRASSDDPDENPEQG